MSMTKEKLLSETTVALGFACRLMEQMQEYWRNGTPVHPGSELANETGNFLKRVMEGPQFTAPAPSEPAGPTGAAASHPLNKFWRDKSGWHDAGAETVSDGCSEGKLAKDAWNAAIDAAASCIVIDGNPAVALKKINSLRFTQ